MRIIDTILDGEQAREIARDMNYSEQGAAIFYFKETAYEAEDTEQEMPKYHKYIGQVEGVEVYYDYGADYYFAVKIDKPEIKENKNIKRINESQLRAIVAESVKKVLREGAFDDAVNSVQAVRDEMYNLAESNPQALAEAVNMFINELGDMEHWAHFGRALSFVQENNTLKEEENVPNLERDMEQARIPYSMTGLDFLKLNSPGYNKLYDMVWGMQPLDQ